MSATNDSAPGSNWFLAHSGGALTETLVLIGLPFALPPLFLVVGERSDPARHEKKVVATLRKMSRP